MLSSPRLLLFLGILLSSLSAYLDETCEAEIARENAEDWKIHGCRACKPLTVEASVNCPKKDYDCDPTLRMRSNVLSMGGSECAQLRCEDANATLFVEKDLVKKVTCADKQWKSTKGTVATSGVCARKCDSQICKTLPESFFSANPALERFEVNEPDDEHPCAWGSCPHGAMAGNSIPPDQPYDKPVELSCTGDRTWKVSLEGRFDYVACKIKQCQSLVPEPSTTLCGERPVDKHKCYDPEFATEGSEKSIMKCEEPKALRYTDNIDKVLNPVCSRGQWTSDGEPIEDTAKVMCIACPEISIGSGDEDPEIVDDTPKEVTCPTKKLTLGLVKPPNYEPTYIKVDSLKCTEKFVWEAELKWKTTEGDFVQFTSLSKAVQNGVAFRVTCGDDV